MTCDIYEINIVMALGTYEIAAKLVKTYSKYPAGLQKTALKMNFAAGHILEHIYYSIHTYFNDNEKNMGSLLLPKSLF